VNKISHDMNAMDLHWVPKFSATKRLMGYQWLAEDGMSVEKFNWFQASCGSVDDVEVPPLKAEQLALHI